MPRDSRQTYSSTFMRGLRGVLGTPHRTTPDAWRACCTIATSHRQVSREREGVVRGTLSSLRVGWECSGERTRKALGREMDAQWW